MASTSEISALSVRLLLLALLALTPTGAGADTVRWERCTDVGTSARVLNSSRDDGATTLEVQACNITEIRRGDFDGLPNLDIIVLYHNDIVHVDWAAFSPVPKLVQLSLFGNKLRKLPVLDEPSLFPSLKGLYLSSNQLTSLPYARTFSTYPQLQWLLLDNNQLEHLHPQLFRPLINLTLLYLSNNKLTYIPISMFNSNKKLRSLKLDGNRISQLQPNFVTELSNAGIRLYSFYLHDNPWHCACLMELLADVKRVGVKNYNRYRKRYIGTQPECIFIGAYPCSRHAPSGLLSAPPRAPDSSCTSP